MVRFAHLADVHLGGWKQKPLQDLNFKAFQKTIEKCIESRLDFVLIAGDLFDSAYPPIEILKETFAEFKKLKESNIPCFIVAGSHDYSVSGKTFLDVLEKAGFCKNVCQLEETSDFILLNPVIHNGVAIYGYPGKKSGLEIPELRRIKLNEAPGLFKIFMLHTTLDKAKGTLPIDAIEADLLTPADYYAMGHLHIDFKYKNFVYPGPVFPNNFQELEDLKFGGFYIVDTSSGNPLSRIDINVKNVLPIKVQMTNALEGTSQIIKELEKYDLDDKIVLLRIYGLLEKGKQSDIKFQQIQEFVDSKNAFFLLKNTHGLNNIDANLDFKIKSGENIEDETIKVYSNENPSEFNKIIPALMNSISVEKQEGETVEGFNNRLLEDAKKVLDF